MKYLITPHPDGKRWNARIVIVNVDGSMQIHYDKSDAFRSRTPRRALIKAVVFALGQNDCDEIKIVAR